MSAFFFFLTVGLFNTCSIYWLLECGTSVPKSIFLSVLRLALERREVHVLHTGTTGTYLTYVSYPEDVYYSQALEPRAESPWYNGNEISSIVECRVRGFFQKKAHPIP
jgi:hypothetical protein